MTVCPIAIAVGCQKCPAVSICPLKGVLGDAKGDGKDGKSKSASASKAKERQR